MCNGLDDNCNGVKDEGDPGGGEPCTVPGKEGECAFGVTRCDKSGKIVCDQMVQPQPETCDGKDNDCNGKIDDNPSDVGQSCNTGKPGVCITGTVACMDGKQICNQNLQPSMEVCNGLDDDCNGTPDDGFSGSGQPCAVKDQKPNSPCAKGMTNCLSGQDNCTQVVFPDTETCNGVDDDCDGVIDNTDKLDGKVCDTGLPGVCAKGKTQCSAGQGTCVPDVSVGSQVEVCDGLDNDCDGMVDNVGDIKLECATKNPTAGQVTTWQCTKAQCQVASCAGTFKDCDGAPANGCEVDTAASTTNCGACGTQCNATNGTPSCSAGQCGIACSTGFGNCDGDASNGCEQPLSTDIKNCGACSKVCDSTNGNPVCNGGACQIQCNSGFGNCDSNADNGCETDVTTSANNCGACGKACSQNNGVGTCSGGTCSIKCNPGFADCDNNPANGCETNLKADSGNCGTCGFTCSSKNGTASCTNGSCGIVCVAGWGDCDGDPSNGCETNLNVTTTNCGTCGKVCDNTNGTATCSAGVCGIQCAAGFGNCDNNAANGCEVDLKNDENNCNVCNKVCNSTNGVGICNAGNCGIICNQGFANCDGLPQNGCEINTTNNTNNCGTCGNICSSANGGPVCSGGQCSITCNPGYADCNKNIAGCETMITTDPANCGACGTACQANNTSSNACNNGSCSPVCQNGFGNCDGNGANGCETNLQTSIANCGTCGTTCTAGNASSTSCAAGVCKPVCNSGFGDCDGNSANGCETNTAAGVPGPNGTIVNCGTCGTNCVVSNGTPTCNSGSCQVQSCSGTYADCDGKYATGCESNTASDPNNCGGCGKKCSNNNATGTCNAGSCTETCNPGFGNCDGQAGNGCEVNLTNDVNNCNACGNVCTPNAAQGVVSVNCTPSGSTGNCAVTACSPTFYDQNGAYNDGCECKEDNVGNTCGAATDVGTIAVDVNPAKVVTGNLVGPNNSDEDWYKITFTVGPSCGYTPKVTLSAGSLPIKMQVYTSCSGSTPAGSFTCGAAPEPTNSISASGIDTWEFTENAACGTYAAHDPLPQQTGSFLTTSSVIYVRVFRTGASTSCFPYTLTINN